MSKPRVWYGDAPNRKCLDCGESVDWDERLRLGHYALGGPAHDDGTPKYDPDRNHGNTPEGCAEQAKLQAHAVKYHQGGLVATISQGTWTLDTYRYSTSLAVERAHLLKKLPFYGVLSTRAPNGEVVRAIIDGCRTLEEVWDRSGLGNRGEHDVANHH